MHSVMRVFWTSTGMLKVTCKAAAGEDGHQRLSRRHRLLQRRRRAGRCQGSRLAGRRASAITDICCCSWRHRSIQQQCQAEVQLRSRGEPGKQLSHGCVCCIRPHCGHPCIPACAHAGQHSIRNCKCFLLLTFHACNNDEVRCEMRAAEHWIEEPTSLCPPDNVRSSSVSSAGTLLLSVSARLGAASCDENADLQVGGKKVVASCP